MKQSKNHESNHSRMKRLAQTLMRLLLGQILPCLKTLAFPLPTPSPAMQQLMLHAIPKSVRLSAHFSLVLCPENSSSCPASESLNQVSSSCSSRTFLPANTRGSREEASSVFTREEGRGHGGRHRTVRIREALSHLSLGYISSQGTWVGRKGRISRSPAPSLPFAQEAGWCTGCSSSGSLPPSAWPESQTAPRRKREGSETHPIFSRIGSKT